jgi:hypothetical protein
MQPKAQFVKLGKAEVIAQASWASYKLRYSAFLIIKAGIQAPNQPSLLLTAVFYHTSPSTRASKK